MADGYLTGAAIRRLADELGLRPSKQRGQNFVTDANTVRRIVEAAGVGPGDRVLEIGPGLGSLTAGLLAAGAAVTAVEIEPVLAARLAQTMAGLGYDTRLLHVVAADALTLGPSALTPPPGLAGASERAEGRAEAGPGGVGPEGAGPEGAGPEGAGPEGTRPEGKGPEGAGPDKIVANLPYNVAVPMLLHCLATFPTLASGLVMVQLEVADRLVAAPGSKVYGIPSAKLAWYAAASRAGTVPASVFWPKPNVESGLVRLAAHEPPAAGARREDVFAVVDAAFAQRRKMLRSALAARYAPAAVQAALAAAGLDPTARGETLTIADFARLAGHL